MDTQPSRDYATGSATDPLNDRIVGETSYPVGRAVGVGPISEVGENVLTVKNRVQWGPIFAGIFTALPVFILMTILGIAIGASVLGPRDDAGEIGTWAAVWGAITAIAAFFVGGWVAAKTAAVEGSFAGLMNGFLVGATGLALIIWLTASGLGNLFGTIGSSAGGLVDFVAQNPQAVEQATETAPAEAQTAADDAATEAQTAVEDAAADPGAAAEEAAGAVGIDEPQDAFDAIRNGAFATFLGYLLPLLAAALGGWLGHHKREELIRGTG